MPRKQDEQLPESARERLRAMRGQEGQEALFTSDLSVNEFLLLQETNFAPAAMVVGTSIYHIGVQQQRQNQNEEMVVLSEALYHARELAMRRMVAEAHELRDRLRDHLTQHGRRAVAVGHHAAIVHIGDVDLRETEAH